MGFSLKAWASHAFKVPKDLRKINVGKEVRRAVTGAVSNFESTVRSAGNSAGETVNNVNDASKNVSRLTWIVGAVAVVGVLWLWRKGR